MRRGFALITVLFVIAAACSSNRAAEPRPQRSTEASSRQPTPSPHPTLTPGIEPCAFITFRGRLYQQDLKRRATEDDVGRSLGRPKGTQCGAYSPRSVDAFTFRGEPESRVLIVVDNYAPIRYVVQPTDLCEKGALTIALGRSGVWHGRSSRLVLIRNASQARCTLSSNINLIAVSPTGRRIDLAQPSIRRRTPLLPGQALNVLIVSGSAICAEEPELATLLEVEVGLVTGAYLRHSQIQTNCGVPTILETFAEPQG